MPELPEVETVVRGLRADLVGARAQEAWCDWPKLLGVESLVRLNARIHGQRFVAILRRGKYITAQLERDWLVIHLRMTGRLYLSDQPRGNDAWVHFSLALEGGRYLAFSDARKFGTVGLYPDLAHLEAKLGPEPLDMPPEALAHLLTGAGRVVKAFLLDQSKIAGIGNIYADEALFLAGVHPQRPVNSLRENEQLALAMALQRVLNQGIRHEGASISWYRKPDGTSGESQQHFQVYGREAEPCYRCDREIVRTVIAQRGSWFCPNCQPL